MARQPRQPPTTAPPIHDVRLAPKRTTLTPDVPDRQRAPADDDAHGTIERSVLPIINQRRRRGRDRDQPAATLRPTPHDTPADAREDVPQVRRRRPLRQGLPVVQGQQNLQGLRRGWTHREGLSNVPRRGTASQFHGRQAAARQGHGRTGMGTQGPAHGPHGQRQGPHGWRQGPHGWRQRTHGLGKRHRSRSRQGTRQGTVRRRIFPSRRIVPSRRAHTQELLARTMGRPGSRGAVSRGRRASPRALPARRPSSGEARAVLRARRPRGTTAFKARRDRHTVRRQG